MVDCRVAAKSGVGHRRLTPIEDAAAEPVVDIGVAAGRVATKSAVGHRQRPIVEDAAAVGGQVAAESAIDDHKRPEAVVGDPASRIFGRVAADCAVAQRNGAVPIVDAAAFGGSRIAANSAVGDRHRRAAPAQPVVTNSAAVPARVTAQSAAAHGQRPLVVEDATADALNGRVAADCAAAQCQGCVIIIVDATATKIGARSRPIADSQPGDSNVSVITNVKYPAGVVGVYGQHVGAGTVDGDIRGPQAVRRW